MSSLRCSTEAARLPRHHLSLRSSVRGISGGVSLQVRTLWWWSRHSSEWPATLDEHLEDRAKRHQKIMRSRYSKALRRRSLWERERDHRWSWAWPAAFWSGHRYGYGYQPLSSSDAPEGKVTRDPLDPNGPAVPDDLHDHMPRDFDSFKAAVDRALERDTYGTLFGRRCRRGFLPDESPWGALARSQPSPATDSPCGGNSQPAPTRPPTDAGKSEPTPRPPAAAETSQAPPSVEPSPDIQYRYDPISMRKVPIPTPPPPPTPTEVDVKPAKPLLETLFSEHGVNIPVKTYPATKVYGLAAEKPPNTVEADPTTTTADNIFDSSKKQELRALMARYKGNTMNTTAHFTEPQPTSPPAKTADAPPAANPSRASPAPDDDAPLFSGTTYAARSSGVVTPPPPSSAWLVNEGFSGRPPSVDDSIEVPVKESSAALEPALDRHHAKSREEQPRRPIRDANAALDRQTAVTSPKVGESPSPNILKAAPPPTEEDIDLLRASDIRAATRTARVTKREVEDEKRSTRARLEADFAARSVDEARPTDDAAPTSKLTRTLSQVWDHFQQYRRGIVAKTMQSMGAVDDDRPTYRRPDRVEGLHDKMASRADDGLHTTASIYDKPPKGRHPFVAEPSQDALRVEEEGRARTASLRETTERAKEEERDRVAQFSLLSNEIKSLYEDHYGAIKADHRQPLSGSIRNGDGAAPSRSPLQSTMRTDAPLHPLSTATRRPGVAPNPVADRHVGHFEPKFAALVDDAKVLRTTTRGIEEELKQMRTSPPLPASATWSSVIDGTREVRRGLHEAQLAIRAIETGRPQTHWNALPTANTNFGAKRIDVKDNGKDNGISRPATVSSEQRDVERSTRPSTGEETTPPPSPKPQLLSKDPEPSPSTTDPTPAAAATDRQPLPPDSVRRKPLDSPFLILSYHSSAGHVEFSPMNEPSRPTTKAADMVAVLARLKDAPEFFKHFDTLKRAGYSLFNGGEHMLIFRKKTARVEPFVETGRSADRPTAAEAATVLDTIPAEVVPVPGPAAPTAPPSRPFENVGGPASKVRRQEDVFSGMARQSTLRSGDKPGPSSTPTVPPYDGQGAPRSTWKRIVQGFTRTLWTIVALGGVAYAVGFVAEGLGAQTQRQGGVDDGDAPGPRKRIVMTGQRPGIYSTESSR